MLLTSYSEAGHTTYIQLHKNMKNSESVSVIMNDVRPISQGIGEMVLQSKGLGVGSGGIGKEKELYNRF